jgi:uncharacterized protein YjbJ (UPF0337 family)
MNTDHVKGKFEQGKGELTGDFGDKVKGTIREGFADIKDKARDLKDEFVEKKDDLERKDLNDTPSRRAV